MTSALLRLCGFAALALCSACTMETPDSDNSSRIAAVVEALQSDDVEDRERATESLERLITSGLTVSEAAEALEAATLDFPLIDDLFGRQVPELLVEAAISNADDSLIPIIQANYDAYPLAARTTALTLLTQTGSEASTTLYVELALAEARDPSGFTYLPTVGLVRNPVHADIVFPDLLEAARVPELTWGVAELALEYFQQGELERGALDDHYEPLDAALSQLVERAGYFAPDESGDWLWGDQYGDVRWITGLLLDVSGYFETDESIENLEAAVRLPDPRLKFFAVRSLMSLGRAASEEDLLAVAASHEVRNWFYEYLRDSGQVDRYPDEYLSQEYFAISDMVNWLIYPTELARAPHDIEVVRSVSTVIDGRAFVHYVLRFRTDPPHWAAENGWMLGVSGPFLVFDGPDPTAWGDTFSTFAREAETDVDAYVNEVRELLDEARAGQIQ